MSKLAPRTIFAADDDPVLEEVTAFSPFGYVPDLQESNPMLDRLLRIVGLPILPRRVEARSVSRMLAASSHDKRIVDLGCGDGVFCMELAKRRYRNVVGVDVSKDKLLLAKRRARRMSLSDRVDLILGDIQNLPLIPESSDEALCNCVLEHIPDDGKALCEASRILKQDGTLVLTVPSKEPRIVIPIGRFWARCPKPIRQFFAPPFLHQLEDPKSFEEEFWKYKQTRFEEIRNYPLSDLLKKLETAGFRTLRTEYNLKLFGAAMWNLIIGLKAFHFNRGMLVAFPLMYPLALLDELLPADMKGEEFAVAAKKA